jgi:Protein of unknown function (DUF3500)
MKILGRVKLTGALLCVCALLSACEQSGQKSAVQTTLKQPTFACEPDRNEAARLDEIVTNAQKLSSLVTATQRADLQVPFTRDNAIRWSNFPITSVRRVGVKLADLNAAQDALADDLIRTALSNCGAKMVNEIREADDFIKPLNARFDWSSGSYFIGFLGAPSTTTPWMLKIGGHHLGINLTFNAKLAGSTPQFNGVEPIRFEHRGGHREPMSAQSSAMSAVARSVEQFPEARLSGTFSDVVKGTEYSFAPGPKLVGGTDTGFPHSYPSGSTGRGVPYSRLNKHSQATVRSAIATYTDLSDGRMSQSLLKSYLLPEMLNQTYIAFSGSPDLSTEYSYVRIDGPRVWIELVVQRAVALPDQLHYHALWRDKLADYGGEFRQ